MTSTMNYSSSSEFKSTAKAASSTAVVASTVASGEVVEPKKMSANLLALTGSTKSESKMEAYSKAESSSKMEVSASKESMMVTNNKMMASSASEAKMSSTSVARRSSFSAKTSEIAAQVQMSYNMKNKNEIPFASSTFSFIKL